LIWPRITLDLFVLQPFPASLLRFGGIFGGQMSVAVA